jgi:preprotein translocase subunit SecA
LFIESFLYVSISIMLKKLFGDENKKALKLYEKRVSVINSFEEGFKKASDSELKAKTQEFKDRLKNGESLDDILSEAFAVVREVAARTVNMRPFDVQLIGGMVLHEGKLAEMKTGEGKTLVATLAVYLNALTEKGVHVVTVNDYLAQRDAVWMGQIYNFLGLSCGVIGQDQSFIYDPEHKELDEERDEKGSFKIVHEFLRPVTRSESYNTNITYGTNSEFGFDYLRDNIEYDTKRLRQREHNFVIIDEIDSILIDEARTPLIISAPTEQSEDLYEIFAGIAEKLKKDEDYEIDEKMKSISVKDSGIDKAEKILGVENIYTEKGIKYVHHLETAIRAKALFQRDKEYVVRDNQVVIVDEFTGRLQPGRRWSEGLHQAIEAKEGVHVQQESRTFASITYQNYFRMYKKLSGMTGTAKTNAEEFLKVYGLDVISIPTNTQIIRMDKNDLIFQNQNGKFKAIARKIKELHKKGQPVLVGTVAIETNELLSEFLNKEGVPHEILNAKNHEREGQIIAQAGKKGGVTIATNMAGRGVDITLGGAPYDQKKYQEVKELGGLFVLGTERHDARRIDNQLRGRSGRQGDPGETQFFVSLEDSLMRIFASDIVRKVMGGMGIPEDEPIENKIITRSLENAQTKIEGFNFDARKHLLEFDNVLNTQRNSVYKRRRKILTGSVDDIENELEKIIDGNQELKKIVEEKKSLLGEEEFTMSARRLILQAIDSFWVDHLELMNYLRSSVNLRAYGQRDPLIEYKKEGLKIFNEMLLDIDEQIRKAIPQIGAGAFAKEEEKLKEAMKKAKLISGEDQGEKGSAGGPGISREKIGRNDVVLIEKDGETKEIKFKKIEEFLKEGWSLKK